MPRLAVPALPPEANASSYIASLAVLLRRGRAATRAAHDLASTVRVIGYHALILLKCLPGNIAFMMILEQDIPAFPWLAKTTADNFAAGLDVRPASGSSVRISAGVDRVRQNRKNGTVPRRAPLDGSLTVFKHRVRKLDFFLQQPQVYLTHAVNPTKSVKD